MRNDVAVALALGVSLGACGSPSTPTAHATRCGDDVASSGGGHAHRAHAHRGDGRGGMVHDFSDVARFEAMFDAPDRDAWQRPVEVVALLGTSPGQTVVDLGTGTGYFLPFLSIAVGHGGHVLALDAEPAMIDHVRARAEREGLTNVEARAVDATGAGLATASADAILVVDTWHHLPDRAAYAIGLRDALRPGGVLLVVDFTRESPQGPPAAHRISAEAVVAELAAAGLSATIAEESLPDQYVVRAVR
jgi:SAM-dependent methyltransferase